MKKSKTNPPFHLGAWIEQSGQTLRFWAEVWGMDPGYLSKCARYQRKIGGYQRRGRNGKKKPPYSKVVFRDLPVDYKEYLDGYYYYTGKGGS